MSNTIATVNHGGHALQVKVETLQKLVISKHEIPDEGISQEDFLRTVTQTDFSTTDLNAIVEGDLPAEIDPTGFGQSAAEQVVADDTARSAFLAHQLINLDAVAEEAPPPEPQPGEAILGLQFNEENDFVKLNALAAEVISGLNGKTVVVDHLKEVAEAKIADGSLGELLTSIGETVDSSNAERIAEVIAGRVQEQSSSLNSVIQKVFEYNETTIAQDADGATVIAAAKLIAADKDNTLKIAFGGDDGAARFDEFTQKIADLEPHVQAAEPPPSEPVDEQPPVGPPVDPERSDLEPPEGENENKLGKGLGIASIVIGALAALGGIFSSDEGSRGKAVAALIGGILLALPFLKPLHNFFWGKGEGTEDAVPAEGTV